MSNINIKRAVDNIRSGTNAYTPIVEIVVNAIQAIEISNVENGRIDIRVIRERQSDLLDAVKSVDGFSVTDNGVGFNQENRDSFDTLYTALKAQAGGKGFGRFTCLKYFENYDVNSTFIERGTMFHRSFSMGRENDIIINEHLTELGSDLLEKMPEETGTNITISKIKGVKFPDKNIDIIARVLVEKLLPYFIDNNNPCPLITIGEEDAEKSIKLNDYLENEHNRQIVELDVPNKILEFEYQDQAVNFDVRVFKFYSPRIQKSKVSLVAHRREVTDTTLQAYIPEFADEFYDKTGSDDGRDRNYIIKVYVFGDYLDDNVSLERGTFNFPKEGDGLFGVSQIEIERAAANVARDTVGEEITARKERKKIRIDEYVEDSAPWHRTISQDADFSSLPMNASSQEIEIHLQRAKLEKEISARTAVAEILLDPKPNELKEKIVEIVGKISQTSKNDLIHYVSMRKCVLDLFGKILEVDEEGKYSSEGDVHDIIMPRKKDSDELDYEQHNLWILDERLNFSHYIASEKPIGNPKGKRTDITIFDKRVAFRGDNQASNPITIFEFKKPQRHDFANPSSDEDPVQQIVRYVNEIRDGKYKTPKGRDILVSDNTPFYGYVVCDLSKKVQDWLSREKDFTPMPDNLGWFRWYGNIKLYIEVLSWTKVLNDAEMRNKIFFHKLGI